VRRSLVTVELKMLILSVLLGIVQIVAASHAASLQRGYRWTASPRDEKVPPLRGVAGRLDRALRNFVETFPLFATVVLVAQVSDTHNALTVLGAQLYFWGRLAYVLLYGIWLGWFG
jgi:uncharacterized MAPEG superfamily protein